MLVLLGILPNSLGHCRTECTWPHIYLLLAKTLSLFTHSIFSSYVHFPNAFPILLGFLGTWANINKLTWSFLNIYNFAHTENRRYNIKMLICCRKCYQYLLNILHVLIGPRKAAFSKVGAVLARVSLWIQPPRLYFRGSFLQSLDAATRHDPHRYQLSLTEVTGVKSQAELLFPRF